MLSNRNRHFYSIIALNTCCYYSYIYFYKIIINVVLVELWNKGKNKRSTNI